MEKNNCLIIFMKLPVAGQVKTRLIPSFGAETSALIYKLLSTEITQAVAYNENWTTELYLSYDSPYSPKQFDMPENLNINKQRGEDLGIRMQQAMRECFEKGYENVSLIGTDSPDLTSGIINQSFKSIDQHGAVVGPGFDGGYYLIGFNNHSFMPEVFEGIQWSTDVVLQQTLGVIRERIKTPGILPFLNDIDTPEDLNNYIFDHAYGTQGARIAAGIRTILGLKEETD